MEYNLHLFPIMLMDIMLPGHLRAKISNITVTLHVLDSLSFPLYFVLMAFLEENASSE